MGQYSSEALDILATTPLIDGHNDWPHLIRSFYDNCIENERFDHDTDLVAHVDLKRLVEGRSGGVFWSAYVNCPRTKNDFSNQAHHEILRDTLQQIDLIQRLIHRYSHKLALIRCADEILPLFNSGKIASLIGVEGLHQIGNSASVLRMYHQLGVRYVTLTHSQNNLYADSATAGSPSHGGLSEAGRPMVREMNRIGMLIDLSHTSEDVASDTLAISAAPVAFTHSSAHAITPHVRNVSDETLDKVQENNGIVMISFVPEFTHIDPAKATLEHVVDHIQYVSKRIGFEHVGLGTDFDGMEASVQGLEDVSKFPALVEALLVRGVSRGNIAKILGLNIIRVLKDVEIVASSEASRRSMVLEDGVKGLWSDQIKSYVRFLYPNAA